ncbi:MAG: glycosyltransferase [Dehalococcoidia bacterium]|nr:glycosyltransferase [Dehalococcoidia bacterium]
MPQPSGLGCSALIRIANSYRVFDFGASDGQSGQVPLPQVLSVVIVSFNAREHLRRCLDSIYAHVTCDFEVCVIDNASRDGSADMVAYGYPKVRLLRNRRNEGYSAAANFAADAAAGDVILFLNPDSELAEDALSDAATYLRENQDVGALGLRLLDPGGTAQPSVRRFPGLTTALFNRHSPPPRLSDGEDADVTDVDWISGACLMTTHAVLDNVGQFDEGFFYGFEDADFCQRLRRAGLRAVYYPMTSVTHTIGVSARSTPTRAVVAHHRGMWRYYRRYLASNPLIDAIVCFSIGLRCAVQVAAILPRRLTPRRGRP